MMTTSISSGAQKGMEGVCNVCSITGRPTDQINYILDVFVREYLERKTKQSIFTMRTDWRTDVQNV